MLVGLPNHREGPVVPTLHAWRAPRVQRLAVLSILIASAGCERAMAPELEPDRMPKASETEAASLSGAARSEAVPFRRRTSTARRAPAARAHAGTIVTGLQA